MTFKKKVNPEKMAEMLNPPNRMTFSEIGQIYNVSRQRVHQVYKEYKKNKPTLFLKGKEPTKEDIDAMLKEGLTLQKISSKLKIGSKKLNRLMNEYGLEKVYVKDQLGKEILYDLFVEQRKTDREIGELYNTSPFTVRALREEHRINSSLRKSYKELIPKELFIELYIEEGLLLTQIAEVFNINTINVARLKRDYKIDEEYKGIQGGKYRAKGVKKEDLFRIKKSLRQRGDLI